MATPYQGGMALGSMLFGGRQQGDSDVFLQRLRQNYTVQKADYDARRALDEAQSSQIQRLARESIRAADIEAAQKGDTAAMARLGEAALRTADTPNLRNYTGGAQDFQEMGFRQQASEAAAAGRLGDANAALFGVASGPQRVNAIDNGYQLSPLEVGGAATATPTENARIAEIGARKSVSDAKAAAGGFKPSAGGSGKRSAGEAKAIVAALQKEMVRPLTAEEVATVYSGGDFNFKAAPLGAPKGDPTSLRWIDGGQETIVPLGSGPAAKAANPRVSTVDGKPVVKVNTPAEAKAAWAKLIPGTGLMLPNGTIRYKD